MYWKDIVEQFKTIDDVFIGKNYSEGGYYVRVRGTNDNGFHDSYTSYKFREVAQEVGKKVSYFIGV